MKNKHIQIIDYKLIIIILLISIVAFLYLKTVDNSQSPVVNNIKVSQQPNKFLGPTPDVFLDPYIPPIRDERIIIPTNRGFIRPMGFRQIGTLYGDTILPLFGQELYSNTSRWNYYTISNNGLKLPLYRHKKSSMNTSTGIPELYSGDIVAIQELGKQFKVSLYENPF